MTNVLEARQALGLRLRELRKLAGLTGKQLAESLAWPHSKISKLENARQTPTDEDIQAWTDATGSESHARALLASLHTLQLQHAEWERVLKCGLGEHQREIGAEEERTRFFRMFQGVTVPGLLQTAEYARARFAQSVRVRKLDSDVDEAVRARMQRQQVLYRSDKRFHFVLTEAVLRYRLCPSDVMLAQLDRLISVGAMRNVRLGVVGFATPLTVDPRHNFTLLDDRMVTIETYSAELNLAQPQEIELYAKVFDQLAAIASYGSEARAIIVRVIDDITQNLEK